MIKFDFSTIYIFQLSSNFEPARIINSDQSDMVKTRISILAIYIAFFINLAFTVNALATEPQRNTEGKVTKTVTVNDYPMVYIEKGKGEPLLLIHGALHDYRTWQQHVSEFSEYNRTIALSLRHYFPEKWDGRDTDLGIQQDVDDVAAFIEKLKLGKVNLLGHARGGEVAMLLASTHPNLIKRLILADPAPLFSMLQNQRKATQYLETRKLVLQASMEYYSNKHIDTGLKTFVNHIAGSNTWDNTSEQNRNVLRQNALSLKSLIDDIQIPFKCQDLKNISAPVLVMTGEYSSSINGQMNQAVSACLKHASKVTVADAGLMMYSSNPTEFIFDVQDFIAPK